MSVHGKLRLITADEARRLQMEDDVQCAMYHQEKMELLEMMRNIEDAIGENKQWWVGYVHYPSVKEALMDMGYKIKVIEEDDESWVEVSWRGE
ncbi:hypothetical protein [Salmonella phage SSBI34]|nr:hypothetical protein [Salmonella phage SSBI34]